MDPTDLEPRERPRPAKPLDSMGVAELLAYRADLEAEIARVDAVVARKTEHRSAADALFKR